MKHAHHPFPVFKISGLFFRCIFYFMAAWQLHREPVHDIGRADQKYSSGLHRRAEQPTIPTPLRLSVNDSESKAKISQFREVIKNAFIEVLKRWHQTCEISCLQS